MRTQIFTLLLTFWFGIVSAQTESWYNYDQEYYKVGFKKTGVYRLYYSNLRDISFAVSNFRNIQLYVRGEEIPKRFSGIEDGIFDEGDFIEFYLKANEGEQDSVWYRPYSDRPPVKSNLFSDETFLFLTIGEKKGLVFTEDAFRVAIGEENWHMAEDFYSFTEEWSFNNQIGMLPYLQQSYFERGESWTGKLIMKDSLAHRKIKLHNFLRNSGNDIEFSALVFTRSHISHSLDIKLGDRSLGQIKNTGFDHFNFKTRIDVSELLEDDSFVFSTQSRIKEIYEAHSWSSLVVKYPQAIDMSGFEEMWINMPVSDSKESIVKIKNAVGNLLAYDISDPLKAKKLPIVFHSDNSASVYLSNRSAAQKLFLTSITGSLGKLKKVIFEKYDKEADYVIITHNEFISSAENFRAYRSSHNGGAHRVLLVDIAKLTDQFNYGEPGPSAIRNFLDYQHSESLLQNRYLLLIGRAMSYPLEMKLRPDQDLVPTVGYPASDNLLSAGLHGTDADYPLYKTGRVNAFNNAQIISYLEKVKDFEKQPTALWRKNILHLNGGNSRDEISHFKTNMELLASNASRARLNPSVEHLIKQTLEPVENVNINKQVNEGLGLITFIGHASPTTPDFNIGYASDASFGFANKGKYPLMYFNGCGVGNIFYRYSTLSTDWLLSKDKGGIAVLANSFWSYSSTSQKYLTRLYDNLYNKSQSIGKSIGEIQRQTIKDVLEVSSHEAFDVANAHQVILQGDPALKIFPMTEPDYDVSEETIQIRNADLISSIGDASQLKITGTINNLGLIKPVDDVTVMVELIQPSGVVHNKGTFKIDKSVGGRFEVLVNVEQAVKSVRVTIDPDHKLTELSKDNNIAEIEVDWNEASNSNLYPFIPETDHVNPMLMVFINDYLVENNSNIFINAPKVSFELRDENLIELEDASITAFLKKPNDEVFQPVGNKFLNLNLTNSNTISGWMTSPSEIGTYSFMINGKDKSGNSSGQPISVNWEITSSFNKMRVAVSPNPGYERVKFSIFNVLKPGIARVVLTDLQGKSIAEERHSLREGSNWFFMEKSINSGSYIYTLDYEGQSFSGRLIVY